MIAGKSGQNLISRVAGTNNLIMKGFITVFLPKIFFKQFYKFNNTPSSISGTGTLSFDCDGIKDIKALPKLLDVLSEQKIYASFACIGMMIEKFPEEHKLIIEYGHEIINHTYSHPFNSELGSNERFDKLDREHQANEIIKCHEVCKNILDYEPIGFRIPHFAIQHDPYVYKILSDIGYSYSSSLLAVKSPTFGAPFNIGDILEFPVITCPKHPFQAFDTYHSFGSSITRHKSKDFFIDQFMELIDFCLKQSMYINLYVDPNDVICNIENFSTFLKIFKENMAIRMYKSLKI